METEISSHLAQRRVARSIERALDGWLVEMNAEVKAGRLTEEQVTEHASSTSAFADAWDEYLQDR